jgi:hypothetical protein
MVGDMNGNVVSVVGTVEPVVVDVVDDTVVVVVVTPWPKFPAPYFPAPYADEVEAA